MTKERDERKCAFGAFLDIVDSLQELNRKPLPRKDQPAADSVTCPFCSSKGEPTGRTCPACGEVLLENIPPG